MRYYEILYIVNPNFERKKLDETMKEIDNRLTETKSKIINHIIWGKKKLAYPMQGHKYGTYILVHYQGGNKDKLDEFDSWLKLSDLVIRHMIVRIEKEPDVLEKVDNESSIKEKEDLKSDKDKSSDDVKDKISKEKNDEET
ncbi:MAG: 30S ribosomal protein S6, partial [Candidatus Neomarinimicrobiota bacterium]|nr:30S ribosomal protein S6 [Candidatus Neomarinimicrobiota bacterium]